MGLLLSRGARVSYADPYVPEVHAREWSGGYDIKAVDMTHGSIAQYDAVVIVTDHKTFDYKSLVEEADVIVDTRNAIKGSHPNVFKLGAPRGAAEGQKAVVG
jgi:UDP-N-acetyl-D-glucosamine dehydrogenase